MKFMTYLLISLCCTMSMCTWSMKEEYTSRKDNPTEESALIKKISSALNNISLDIFCKDPNIIDKEIENLSSEVKKKIAQQLIKNNITIIGELVSEQWEVVPADQKLTIHDFGITQDGAYIVTYNNDGQTGVWDTQTHQWEFPNIIEHKSSSLRVGNRLVIWQTTPGKIRCWNLCRHTTQDFQIHTKNIATLELALNDERSAISASDKIAKIWDTQTGNSIATLFHETPITCGLLSKNNLHAYFLCKDNKIYTWGIKEKECIHTYDMKTIDTSPICTMGLYKNMLCHYTTNGLHFWSPYQKEELFFKNADEKHTQDAPTIAQPITFTTDNANALLHFQDGSTVLIGMDPHSDDEESLKYFSTIFYPYRHIQLSPSHEFCAAIDQQRGLQILNRKSRLALEKSLWEIKNPKVAMLVALYAKSKANQQEFTYTAQHEPLIIQLPENIRNAIYPHMILSKENHEAWCNLY